MEFGRAVDRCDIGRVGMDFIAALARHRHARDGGWRHRQVHRRHAHERQRRIATERGQGYRRLKPEEIITIGQTARARIRGTARRGARSIAAGVSGANDIAAPVQRAILAEQTALGLLEHMARDKNLPTVPETENRPLPVAVAAKEFLRSIGGT